jgi:hypothetical protein
MALRQAWHIVQAVDLLNAPARHQAVVDHGLAAGAAFFGRLEDHDGRPVEIAGLGQIFGSAEQHGGMAVMAAGVHHARNLRGVGHAALFFHRQRVHVGAQADDAVRRSLAASDDADHAGAADPGHDLVAAEFLQTFGDDSGRAMHFVQEFRMLVKIMAPGGNFIGERGNTIDDRHGTLVELE